MAFSVADIVITAVIMAAVLWSAHRIGQANPVGTGKLAKRMDALELKVVEQGERLGGVDASIIRLADSSKTTADSVAALRIEVASDRGVTERTWASVSRLEGFFIEQSFKGERR